MLEELRNKPRAARESYAFWGATVITGLIALVWAVAFTDKIQNTSELTSGEKQTASAFSQFFSDIKNDISNKIDQGISRVGSESEKSKEDEETESKSEILPVKSEQEGVGVMIGTTTTKEVQIAPSSKLNH